MKLDIVMPKMGESVMEGTIIKWHKNVGDTVEKDEAVLDIATDKVDTEVPASEGGIIAEILFQEGDTVEVGSVIARIETNTSAKIEPSAKTTEPSSTVSSSESILPTTTKDSPSSDNSNYTLINVVMPKMGESVMEGTIVKWHKKEGDQIEKDESLLDIATDKVDTEVPASEGGIIAEILFQEGDTVEVGATIAKIKVGDGKIPEKENSSNLKTSNVTPLKQEQPEKINIMTTEEKLSPSTPYKDSKRFYSPVVRNIANKENISIQVLNTIPGSGIGNRVTKKDILNYLKDKNKPSQSMPSSIPSSSAGKMAIPYDPDRSQVVPMSNLRKLIADHMVLSRKISAHVTSVAEADVSGLMKLVKSKKETFLKANNVKLTITPFFIDAAVKSLKKFEMVNASIEGDNIILKKYINIGVAVALGNQGTGGLIVPVIKDADKKNIAGLALSLQDVATRAKSKKLLPEDLQGGTFTITNYGVTGNLFGSPIINQPQVAILGTGAISKRPVVKNIDGSDAIVIRSLIYLSLSYDHRIVDGAQAGYFLKSLVETLESYSEDSPI